MLATSEGRESLQINWRLTDERCNEEEQCVQGDLMLILQGS